jgi:acyl carrier protein
MDESKFLKDFSEIFDDTDASELSMDTEFKNLDEWSSIAALGLLAVMEEEYEAELSSKDIEKSSTVRDIYNIVKG